MADQLIHRVNEEWMQLGVGVVTAGRPMTGEWGKGRQHMWG